MKLKIVENYDSSFVLESNQREVLFSLLKDQSLLDQISKHGEKIEFTELLFQPIPYSPNTPKGMPIEFEQYYDSEDYIVINVPPPVMFKAKIFQPSRLCAIYRKVA